MATVTRNLDQILDDFINVKNYGALGNGIIDADGSLKNGTSAVSVNGKNYDQAQDDSPFIQRAIYEANKKRVISGEVHASTVHIPAGVYVLKTPLTLMGCNLVGEGYSSVLIGYGIDKASPLLYVGYQSKISDLRIQYDSFEVPDNGLMQDEKVLIRLFHPIQDTYPVDAFGYVVAPAYTAGGKEYHLSNRAMYASGMLQRLWLMYCGTGITSARTLNSTDISYAPTYSNTYDTITIWQFRYRAIDFSAWWTTGSIFNNVSMRNEESSPAVDCALSLTNGQFENVLHQINVENIHLRNTDGACAIRIDYCNNLFASTIHIENVIPTRNNQAIVSLNNFSGTVEALTYCNSNFSVTGVSVIQLDDTKNIFGMKQYGSPESYNPQYSGGTTFRNNRYLKIGVLSLGQLGPQYTETQQTNYGIVGLNVNIVSRKINAQNTSDAPITIDMGGYSYYNDSEMGWNGINGTQRLAVQKADLDEYAKFNTYGNLQFVQKYYGPSSPAQQAFIAPYAFRDLGTKTNPAFSSIPNPVAGQIVYTQENKSYIYTPSGLWKALN